MSGIVSMLTSVFFSIGKFISSTAIVWSSIAYLGNIPLAVL
jgi:hypothetical protein